MNQIQQLINQMCPNGVEWKTLGEVCNTITTGRLNANAMVENGLYPFFTCDKQVFKIDSYAFDCEAILISGNGSQVGHINYYKGKFNAYQRTYILTDLIGISYAFLLHYFNSFLKKYILKNCKKGSVPYITLPMLQDFQIPVPPLAIQTRIVEILDHFTNLTANHTAELALRRKQFEHFREKLLSLDGVEGVEWKKLGEVFDTRNGYTPSKANSKFWKDGNIPWFRMEDIRDKGRFLSDSYLHITESAIKGKGLFKANSFILATTATIGEHALLIADSQANQRFTNLQIRKSLSDKLDVMFMYYYMFVVDDFCKSHTNKSGFASVDMGALKKMPIPLPPLATQHSIVSILDKFTALIENIEKELALRQKQYEYYREELLRFERTTF